MDAPPASELSGIVSPVAGQKSPLIGGPLVSGDEERNSKPASWDFPDDDGKMHAGLGFWQAVLSVVGMMSGFTGTVLMTSLIYTGWLGFLIYVTVMSVSAYTATLLGSCWVIVQEKWRDDRHPFGAIAYEAGGKWTRMACNALLDAACFGGNCIMLLIVSDIVYLIVGRTANGTFCYWPLGFGLIVCPFMWLGSPKDNWQLGGMSLMSCALALLLIFIDGATQLGASVGPPSPPVSGWHLSLVTGSSLFAVTTHYALPSVQRDMRSPEHFGRCAVTAHGVFFGILSPATIVGYFAFRPLVHADTGGVSIFYIMPSDPLTVTPLVLLLLHSLLSMVPSFSPLFQHLEELSDIPEVFGWKRVTIRSAVILLMVFFVETFPQIAVLLTLFSELLLPPIAFFLPAVFYLRLRSANVTDAWSLHRLRHVLDTIACVALIALSPVVMVATSAVTIKAIADGETLFVSPCYVNATAAHV